MAGTSKNDKDVLAIWQQARASHGLFAGAEAAGGAAGHLPGRRDLWRASRLGCGISPMDTESILKQRCYSCI